MRSGAENFFLFGLTADQVEAKQKAGYRGRQVYESNPAVKEVLDLIGSGFFSPEDRNLFKPLVDSLLDDDRYLVLADFDAYAKAQEAWRAATSSRQGWWRSAILNVARMGFFSSDRTIREYAKDIWGISPEVIRSSASTTAERRFVWRSVDARRHIAALTSGPNFVADGGTCGADLPFGSTRKDSPVSPRYVTIDANEAVASVAHRLSEVIAIYPITPASPMGELSDEWSAAGKKNLWGQVPERSSRCSRRAARPARCTARCRRAR